MNLFDNIPDLAKVKVDGHVFIKDMAYIGDPDYKVVLDDHNAVHFENMSYAIARSLGNKSNGTIERMVFGNGGATVSGTGVVTYLPPNVIGQSADLYSPTFFKIIDDNNTANTDPTRNYMEVGHVPGNFYSDLICVALLSYGEPSDQQTFDNSGTMTGDYVFNEIGLKDYSGNLLTHITFHPVQKSLNRLIEVRYTLRIQMV